MQVSLMIQQLVYSPEILGTVEAFNPFCIIKLYNFVHFGQFEYVLQEMLRIFPIVD